MVGIPRKRFWLGATNGAEVSQIFRGHGRRRTILSSYSGPVVPGYCEDVPQLAYALAGRILAGLE